MKSDSESSGRRVPPPPPPRGVTLRAASVTGVAPASNRMVAPALASSSSVPAVNRLHLAKQTGHSGGYLETRYAYSVNGALGSAAQASAAAAFFAR